MMGRPAVLLRPRGRRGVGVTCALLAAAIGLSVAGGSGINAFAAWSRCTSGVAEQQRLPALLRGPPPVVSSAGPTAVGAVAGTSWTLPLGAAAGTALLVGGLTVFVKRNAARSATLLRRARINRIRRQALSTLLAEETDEKEEPANTALVQKTSVLVLGATGTLGRQVVRQFLMAGYNVRCMLRNRVDRPFGFLQEWGATVIVGNLERPETLPQALIGVHTVVDCSAARPEESIYEVDWEGKKALIQCCEKMAIQRYIFVSIKDCDKFTNVPLMNIKHLTEKFLAKSGLRYTVVRTAGYMQPLISQYATAILDDQKVWGDDGSSPGIAYIDTQDAARMIASAASKESMVGETLTITGPEVWSTSDVIQLCESLTGKEAEVQVVNSFVLTATQFIASLFQYSVDVAERLRFVEVTSATGGLDTMTGETYAKLGVEQGTTRTLEEYFNEFYRRIFEKLTKGEYEMKTEASTTAKATSGSTVTRAEDDKLKEGQPAERDVALLFQRNMAGQLQSIFEDKRVDADEDEGNAWFGWTLTAERVNGRSAMFGIALGLFTEFATNDDMNEQIIQLVGVWTPQALY